MRRYGVQLTIAGIRLRLFGLPESPASWPFDRSYREFLSFPPVQKPAGNDCLTLAWKRGDLPDIAPATVLFDSDSVWKIMRWQDRLTLVQFDRPVGGQPCQIAAVHPGWRHGELYVRAEPSRQQVPDHNPLGYPLDELLVIHLLAQGRGTLFHACGLDDNGQGLLFIGESGAGKSTTARLWQKLHGVTLLSDDRVIVRRRETGFWLCGTPWSGEVGVASSRMIRLRHVFLLRHGLRNRAQPLSPAQAVAQMLRGAFPPFWDRASMAFTLSFLAALVETVPCYHLDFVPDNSAVRFVRQRIANT